MKIMIKESELKNRIAKIINESIFEGTTNREDLENWEQVKEMVGAETMLSELSYWLDDRNYHEFLEHMDRYYDLGLYADNREDEEEEEDLYESCNEGPWTDAAKGVGQSLKTLGKATMDKAREFGGKLNDKFNRSQAEQEFMYRLQNTDRGNDYKYFHPEDLAATKRQERKLWDYVCQKYGIDPEQNI